MCMIPPRALQNNINFFCGCYPLVYICYTCIYKGNCLFKQQLSTITHILIPKSDNNNNNIYI